jgi:hypothetical protein
MPSSSREIYPRSPALLFRCHKPPPMHTNSVNGEPKVKFDGAPVRSVLGTRAIWSRILVLATKSTCFCAAAQHAHAHELFFGLQSLVERGVPPHSLGHFIFRHSRPLRTRTENATVLNRVAMRAGQNVHNRVQGKLQEIRTCILASAGCA